MGRGSPAAAPHHLRPPPPPSPPPLRPPPSRAPPPAARLLAGGRLAGREARRPGGDDGRAAAAEEARAPWGTHHGSSGEAPRRDALSCMEEGAGRRLCPERGRCRLEGARVPWLASAAAHCADCPSGLGRCRLVSRPFDARLLPTLAGTPTAWPAAEASTTSLTWRRPMRGMS